MSVKLKKVNGEIEKYEKKQADISEKLKSLYKERSDLENLEMIDYLKKNKTSLSDLKSLLTNLNKENGDIIPLAVEGQKDENY